MKIRLNIIALLILSFAQLFAQLPNRGCGTVVPGAQYDSLFKQKVIDFLNANSATDRVQANYQIPVIIHVIHGGEAVGNFPNLAPGQLNSQITVLNDDFGGIGFNSGNYPPTAFQVYAGNTVIAASSKDSLGRIGISNTGISFCLALKDSIGNLLPEPGIERMHWNTIPGAANPTSYTTSSSFTTFMNNVVKPATIWSPNKYLNIWVSDVNTSLGMIGFTAFPPLSGLSGISGASTSTTDGLWIWAKCFGSQNIYSTGVYSAPYNYGRTSTHELSHYFGIRHIWGDASCATDYCNDTPPQQGFASGIPIYPYLPNSCAASSPSGGVEGIMFMNFADYTDDAGMYMFTDEQKARMQTAMLNSPYRKSLGTHGLCSTSALVVANFSITPSSISQGQSVSITDMSTSTSAINSWNYISAASTVTSSTLQNPSFTFNTVGTHTISLTVNSAGVNASTTKTLQVSACPVPTVSASSINITCNGLCNGSATMFSNGGAPFSYSWMPAVSSSSIASGLCVGNYTCVITNSCGISATKVVTINSPVPLNVAINVSGAPACFGNTVNLTANASGGTPGYSFNWSNGSTLSAITVTPSVIPVTVYSVNVNDSQGCSASKTVSITVNPAPSITVTPKNQTICSGKTASVSLSGAQSYTTNPGAITLSSYTASPTSTTVYTITGVSSVGCIGKRNDTIKVAAPPNIFSSVSSNTVCFGSILTFSNSGALTYTLNPSSLTGNVINVASSVLGTTIFTVAGSGSFGCINTKTLSVSTFSLPVVSVTPASATICSGKSVVLSASGANSYTWAGSGAMSNAITVTPTVSTTYSVLGKASNGCTKSASSSVNVIAQPVVSINSPSTNVCFGYTMAVTANGASNYSWSNGATTNSIIIQPFSATVYNVIGNNGMCSDTAFLSINVLPPPTVSSSASTTLACVGQSIYLNATGNAVFYYWLPDSLAGAAQTVQIFTPTTYTVYGQGSNGCFFLSKTFVDVKPGNAVIPVSTPSTVCIGDSAILSVIGGYVPLWDNNPVPNTEIVTPMVSSSYTVSAMDLNGCISDIVFNVDINSNCDIITYNGFTPNGDGINDFFTIDNIDKFPNNRVLIYNRWGNKIFSTSGYNNQNNNWDGKLNGKVVTSGTYFYIIIDNSEKLLKKGWIELTN